MIILIVKAIINYMCYKTFYWKTIVESYYANHCYLVIFSIYSILKKLFYSIVILLFYSSIIVVLHSFIQMTFIFWIFILFIINKSYYLYFIFIFEIQIER